MLDEKKSDKGEHDDAKHVYGVDNESKGTCLHGTDAVYDKTGLYYIMPGAGTVGGGHNHRKGDGRECQKCGIGVQV